MSTNVEQPGNDQVHTSTSRRRGQSIELVPFGEDEDYALLAQWVASAAGTYMVGQPQFPTAEQVKAALLGGRSRTGYLLVKTLDGHKIGAIEWQTKKYNDSYTLGTIVGDTGLWGRGYGAEAAMLALEMLFHELNAHRVELTAGSYNKAMMEILTAGFIHIEGVLRDYYFLDGEYHDAVVGSILRSEYYNPPAEWNIRPRDVIPASEKRVARELLRKYLADHPLAI